MRSNRSGRSFPSSGSICRRRTSDTPSRYLRHRSRVNLGVAKAESLPVANESQDALISIFLFHELPPKVRRVVLRECARVLKPGEASRPRGFAAAGRSARL